jgi:tetratricopeptide (TPR) repeat protein
VALFRKLADSRPEAFSEHLALSLNNFAHRLDDPGSREDARAAAEEAVALYRKLADARPETFLPDLARCLGGYGWALYALDRPTHAAECFAEGLRAAFPLFDTQPWTVTGLLEWLAQRYRDVCNEANLPPAEDLIPILDQFDPPET